MAENAVAATQVFPIVGAEFDDLDPSSAINPWSSMPPMRALAMLPPPRKVILMIQTPARCPRRSQRPFGKRQSQAEGRGRTAADPAKREAIRRKKSARGVHLFLSPKIAVPMRTRDGRSFGHRGQRSCDMPMDKVSRGEPPARKAVKSRLSSANCSRWRTALSVGSGIAIKPTQKWSAGKAATRVQNLSPSAGLHPLLLASPETLTWTHT